MVCSMFGLSSRRYGGYAVLRLESSLAAVVRVYTFAALFNARSWLHS